MNLCYFLYIASPLTLSEVRAMLPAGAWADLADLPLQQALKRVHPRIQTVASLLVGRCSCGFIRPRDPDRREDERHLRERYRDLGVSRGEVIAALERHRRGENVPPPGRGWSQALVELVLEHARNAGPTLYLLHFSSSPSRVPGLTPMRTLKTSELTASRQFWLTEGTPTLVFR